MKDRLGLRAKSDPITGPIGGRTSNWAEPFVLAACQQPIQAIDASRTVALSL